MRRPTSPSIVNDHIAFCDLPERDLAGALDFTVEMNRAGTALRDAATIRGTGQADLFSDDPQQGRIGPPPKLLSPCR